MKIALLEYFVFEKQIYIDNISAFNFIEFSKSKRLLDMVNKKIDSGEDSYEVLVSKLENESDMKKVVQLRDKIDRLLGMRFIDKG